MSDNPRSRLDTLMPPGLDQYASRHSIGLMCRGIPLTIHGQTLAASIAAGTQCTASLQPLVNLGNNLGLVWGCMMPYKIMPIRKGLYEALQNGYPVTWTSNGSATRSRFDLLFARYSWRCFAGYGIYHASKTAGVLIGTWRLNRTFSNDSCTFHGLQEKYQVKDGMSIIALLGTQSSVESIRKPAQDSFLRRMLRWTGIDRLWMKFDQ